MGRAQRKTGAPKVASVSAGNLRSLVDTAVCGIVSTAMDGTILSVNPAFCRMLGRASPGGLVGRDIALAAYRRPEDGAAFLARVARGDTFEDVEVPARRRDGTALLLRHSGHVVRDRRGARRRIEMFVEDVTERRGLEARYRSLFEHMVEGVASCEMLFVHGVPTDSVYLAVNPAFEALTGLKDVVGRRLSEVIPGIWESNPGLLAAYGRVAATGKPERLETYVPALGIWLSISAFSPEPGRYVSVFDNITERKRTEDALALQNVVLSTQQETSPDGILVVDEHAHILTYNRRFVELWGVSEELVARGGQQAVLESALGKIVDPAAFLARVHYLYEHRDEKSQEEIALKDGRIIERYSAPMLGANGKHYGRIWYFRDITGRRRAEQALQASETHFRSLIENGMDLITIVDREGRVLYVSPPVTRLLGYRPHEMVGQVAFAYVHPDDLARVVAAFGRAVAGDTRDLREAYRFRHKDGSWRTLESVVTNLLSEPTVAGVVVNSRDITERAQAEETLRWEQYLVTTLMEHMPDAIYFKDIRSRFLRVNRSWARRCGLSDPAQAVGRTDADVFATDHADAALKIEQDIMRSGEPVVNLEEMETWPDGSSAWVSTTKLPLRDAAGSIIGTFGISRDITERKRAEEQLQRSEAEFRSLIEHSPLGIYRSTLDGRFLTVNPALVRMLGYGWPEELLRLDIGRDVYVDPEDRQRLIETSPPHVEVVWKRRDGAHIVVQLSSRAIPNPAGEGECYEGLVQDVTEQRSLETQFRQAQRLEAVGRLAGGVAHDFNNILTAITGYSDLALEDLAPEDPHRSEVEEIKAAALRATALTRQLLAFSRKQVFQTRVLDLNRVIRTLDKMLRRLIGEDVKLELSLTTPLGAIRADPGQIEQVVLNLAVNSRDAMPSGGRLTVETASVAFDEAYARDHAGTLPGRYVMLAVSDTGIGMDEETRSHIFEPFFTTKEQGKGTGLGLATVYGIVRQSGGHVWVYSEPGRGATFKIYLPQVDELPEEDSDQAQAEPVAGGAETVLLAEDDPSVRAVVSDVLTQKGYRVLRAPEGQSALEMAHAHPAEIHLLVTDLVMPGMTGRELADVLTAERPGLRVLYMSGYTDDAVVRHRVLEAGMPYLQKPFAPRALASKVREVLDRT